MKARVRHALKAAEDLRFWKVADAVLTCPKSTKAAIEAGLLAYGVPLSQIREKAWRRKWQSRSRKSPADR